MKLYILTFINTNISYHPIRVKAFSTHDEAYKCMIDECKAQTGIRRGYNRNYANVDSEYFWDIFEEDVKL